MQSLTVIVIHFIIFCVEKVWCIIYKFCDETDSLEYGHEHKNNLTAGHPPLTGALHLAQ